MKKEQVDVIVLGAGPGGYAAAFYAADLGRSVTLIEMDESLGGVCLNRGCIPSKALIHATDIMKEAEHAAEFGISFSKPKLELDKLRQWKQSVIGKLSGGIKSLAKARKVDVIHGRGILEDSTTLRVETDKGQRFLEFKNLILATGSKPALPAAFDLGNKRIMTSTEALEVEDVPKKLLVVGGGYIGMELGTVYAALGSKITLAEAGPGILAGADADLVRPVMARAKKAFEDIRFNVRVQKMATKGKTIEVTIEDEKGKKSVETFDKVLVSIGRSPNSENIGIENTKIKLDDRGYVKTNDQLQTNESHIYAIGDICGGILLAHKASKEAKIAVDAMCGDANRSKDIMIPAVVFTDPEVAWVGLTETEAKEQGIKVNVAKFPWAASGRALTLDRTDGLTKLILEPETDRVLGVGIVGVGAGDLIGEGCVAVEMGANAEDLAEITHPHPTLNETVMEAAEAFYGHSAHAAPKRK
jgi:dihydrolipoamide dehydrogenase